MDNKPPYSELRLNAASYTDDLQFRALADVSLLVSQLSEHRVIGGAMLSLHIYRWGMPETMIRETRDIDLGTSKIALKSIEPNSQMNALGYKKESGCRFVKETPSGKSVIDLLVPSYGSRARQNVSLAGIHTTEVPGLAEAFREPGVSLKLHLKLLNKETLKASVCIPDLRSALWIKVEAFALRRTVKDATDIWRLLELNYQAGFQIQLQHKKHHRLEFLLRDSSSEWRRAILMDTGWSQQHAQQKIVRCQALYQELTS